MHIGSSVLDTYTSISLTGSGRWGTRTETKNVNSLRSVERAVRSEVARQAVDLALAGKLGNRRAAGGEEAHAALLCFLQARRGICRMCYGRNLATMAMVDLGEATGILAAPLEFMQASMDSSLKTI